MKRTLLYILTLLVLTVVNAQAATYYVATNGNDSNPGSQTQPFRTIARGIAAAADGDTVSVADGTYNEHDLDFGSKNLTLRSQSGNSSACFLDCQQQGLGIKITGGQTAATVSGLTIRNGRTSIHGTGAAISISYSSATISNCIFSACKAIFPALSGDAVRITHSPGVTIVGSYFINNGGESHAGGAVSVGDSEAITISDSFFDGNLSGTVQAQFCNSGTITRCTFTNNRSISGAGALSWRFYGVVSVDRCIFTGNLGNSSIYNQGGAICFDEGELTVTNSLFVGNATTINSGSTHAASIMLYSHQNGPLSAKIANCTILADTNLDMDGNVVVDCPQLSDGRPNLTVTNCILRGGFQRGDCPSFSQAKAQVTYSNLQFIEFRPGGGNIDTDPKFVNPAGGDYHLQSTSPCINTGTASAPGLPATDMDGLPRVMGSAPDMGAYELWTASIGAWFVDKVLGNDTNPGSPIAPFRTVNMALSRVMAPSDFTTIHVKAGNYGSDRSTITKKVRFVNWGSTGQARIGKQ
jgi:hypothetical protein